MHTGQKAGWFQKGIRGVLSTIDSGIYTVLSVICTIFFNVASSEIFSGEMVSAFFGRIQLIIGVFMIFKVSIAILSGIVNPDNMMSGKDGKGATKLVVRICVSLVMLVMVLPISLPNAQTSWEKQLNNNGLLFGTLYEFQSRILSQNTLAKLILGTNSEDAEDVREMGDAFAADVIRTFIMPNVTEEAEAENPVNYDERSNWVCKNAYSNLYEHWAGSTDAGVILSLADESCDAPGWWTGDLFAFYYMSLVSTVVGIALVIIMAFLTIDVAIRAVKLAVLRLLSPIPIITYVDPKSEKDGGFANWVKMLTSTYLDLFVRLAVIYFILFIIKEIASPSGGIVIEDASGIIGGISKVFIYIGLFMFALRAPKFIKDIFGIKGGEGAIGLAGLIGGTAALVGGAGAAGAMMAAGRTAMDTNSANGQGKQAGPAWQQGSKFSTDLIKGDMRGKTGILANRANRHAERRLDSQDFRARAQRQKRAAKLLQDKYGITAAGIDDEKAEKYRLEDLAARSQNLYDRFSESGITGLSRAERNDFSDFVSNTSGAIAGMSKAQRSYLHDRGYLDYDVATGQYSASATAMGDMQGFYQEMLQERALSDKATAGKQGKKYEELSKTAEKFGLDAADYDKYRASLSDRVHGTYDSIRHPFERRAARDTYEHQSHIDVGISRSTGRVKFRAGSRVTGQNVHRR